MSGKREIKYIRDRLEIMFLTGLEPYPQIMKSYLREISAKEGKWAPAGLTPRKECFMVNLLMMP